MSKEEIIPTFAILLVAGSETTGTLLSTVTYFLCKYPEVLRTLTDEIRSSFNNEDEITIVSVNKLKYELAVLEEALKIFPPAPNGGSRVVLSRRRNDKWEMGTGWYDGSGAMV